MKQLSLLATSFYSNKWQTANFSLRSIGPVYDKELRQKTNNDTTRPHETPSRRNDKQQEKEIVNDVTNDRLIFLVRRRNEEPRNKRKKNT